MSDPAFETLRIERVGDRVLLAHMDRPAKLNAMSQTMLRELPGLMAFCDADPELSVCVLTGSAGNFSAGGDIADFDRLEGLEDCRHQVGLALGAFSAIETSQTPVIAAVEGIAFGGGTEIAIACDIALADPGARFSFKEVTLGLMPGFGLLRGPERIGRGWTARLALSGEEIDAERACRIGLVQEVVKGGRLLEHATALARSIGRHSPTAIAAGKRMINQGVAPPGLAGAIEATALLQATPETRARAAEFVARSVKGDG
ncbi:MAG TPA: enoyl-CoA hydratase/isomerase family protein [Solirubrobacterales bacterium]|nr:enoyl-CoA hydratase/isomerase family protein [Solirubrobacterales bacterium]